MCKILQLIKSYIILYKILQFDSEVKVHIESKQDCRFICTRTARVNFFHTVSKRLFENDSRDAEISGLHTWRLPRGVHSCRMARGQG